MKALAILAACLCLSLPAQAFQGGPHFPGGHPGGFPGGHNGHGHHHGHGFGPGLWGGVVAVPEVAAPEPAPAVEPVAEPIPVPVPYCPRPTRPKTGPHIIYIGAKPTIHGPQVIYGTD